MAAEFCPTCKKNTKPKCARCPRNQGEDPVAWMERNGLVHSRTSERHYPTIRFMGINYTRSSEDEEEHF